MNDQATRRAEINAELSAAYQQLRAHLHDPWANFCYICDEIGPCRMFTHWLERLHILEQAEQDLWDDEPDPDSEPDDEPDQASRNEDEEATR